MAVKPKSIIVTGDFTIDWNIARIRRADGAGQPGIPTTAPGPAGSAAAPPCWATLSRRSSRI